jgi:hypothetical protein
MAWMGAVAIQNRTGRRVWARIILEGGHLVRFPAILTMTKPNQ